MRTASVLCGDRDSFAIECHVDGETATPARNAVGLLWFWIGGEAVGNRDVRSLPGIAANELRQTLMWCGRRSDPVLYASDPIEVLEAVRRGLYDARGASVGDAENWARFLICMLPGGHEYMDGWLTVMIEASERVPGEDRVLYSGVARDGHGEVWVPRGSYRSAVQQFLNWLDTV